MELISRLGAGLSDEFGLAFYRGIISFVFYCKGHHMEFGTNMIWDDWYDRDGIHGGVGGSDGGCRIYGGVGIAWRLVPGDGLHGIGVFDFSFGHVASWPLFPCAVDAGVRAPDG